MIEAGYDILFPEDEEKIFKCPFCGRIIPGSESVEWIDKEEQIFRCPECGKELET